MEYHRTRIGFYVVVTVAAIIRRNRTIKTRPGQCAGLHLNTISILRYLRDEFARVERGSPVHSIPKSNDFESNITGSVFVDALSDEIVHWR